MIFYDYDFNNAEDLKELIWNLSTQIDELSDKIRNLEIETGALENDIEENAKNIAFLYAELIEKG